jgi:hypothetical protein
MIFWLHPNRLVEDQMRVQLDPIIVETMTKITTTRTNILIYSKVRLEVKVKFSDRGCATQ